MKHLKPYFSHDEGARNDPKLVEVLMTLGHEGKSVYWDLVEMLYEQGGYLMLTQCKGYAFALRTDIDLIKKLISDFDLFVTDGTRFWSNTCLARMEMRDAKKLARAEAGAKGGKIKAEREAAAKALLEQAPSNASDNPSIAIALQAEILASKRNKIKVKESKSNDLQTAASPAVDLTLSLKAEKTNEPRGAAQVLADEASVFTIAGFRAFVNTIGMGKIDLGFYLPQIQYEAGKQAARPNAGPGKTWEAFVKFYLNNERKYDRLTFPPAAAAPGSYPGPNPVLQVTTTSTSYSREAIAARNVTKY